MHNEIRARIFAAADELPAGSRLEPLATDQYRADFRLWLRTGAEPRNLAAGTGGQGGYLADLVTVAEFEFAMQQESFVRRLARVVTVPHREAAVPVADFAAGQEAAAYLRENEEAPVSRIDSLGSRSLVPKRLSRGVEVSTKMLRLAPQADAYIVEVLSRPVAQGEERTFLIGSGSGEPLGIFTESAAGVPASQNVVSGSDTGVTAAAPRAAFGKLSAHDRARAVWFMHPDVVDAFRGLQGSDGQFVFKAAAREGERDMLEGRPIYESDWCPNTFEAGAPIAVLGNPRRYAIASGLELMITANPFVKTGQGLVPHYATLYSDGQPAVGTGFARIVCGTT